MSRRFGYLHLIVAAIIGGVLVVAVMQFLTPQESYNECLVREMRGQAPVMFLTAIDICSKLHGAKSTRAYTGKPEYKLVPVPDEEPKKP
jgi:hypothetical protein